MSKASTLCHTYEQDTLTGNSLLARASFTSTCQKLTERVTELRGRFAVAADAGAAGVTAALYAREQRDGTWVVFDEYYHDARTRVQIGEGAHADAIIARHGIPDVCVVDGPNLRHEMATRGAWASLPDKTGQGGERRSPGRLLSGPSFDVSGGNV